jgi:hypothetical protein
VTFYTVRIRLAAACTQAAQLEESQGNDSQIKRLAGVFKMLLLQMNTLEIQKLALEASGGLQLKTFERGHSDSRNTGVNRLLFP